MGALKIKQEEEFDKALLEFLMQRKKLTEKTRQKLVEFLKDCLMETMFGDGLEDDYILNGFHFIGLNSYGDEELLEEFLNHSGEEEELYIRAKKELGL